MAAPAARITTTAPTRTGQPNRVGKAPREERKTVAPTRLGSWIKATRSSQGVSQRSLADRSGVSRSYLCDIERGRGAQPSVATLDKLAAALGASRADLLRAAGLLEAPGRRADAGELRLLGLYRDLSPDARAQVERFVRFLHHEEHHRVQTALPDHAAEPQILPLVSSGAVAAGPTLFDLEYRDATGDADGDHRRATAD
ncbi:MAG: hypothetical protein AVDCRST_MAG49-2377 [uncultured Thermomicrobiales bacterium]|uniref:HTH cro/C1-type domain-containing protein n=1 Tax=uncultured Thermomicrobiales bacterium TaxID=1645740 RepID=A0A6J4UWR9_9BACT|nr:MAG: hypothetical protein AVDCRST_MAG49-2377 [uncultured Thermomicrobiales bacterium]